MTKRTGRYTVAFDGAPFVLSGAAAVGKTEGEGPMADVFDVINENDGVGCATWEHAEAALVRQATEKALQKAGRRPEEIDIVFAGDLMNQCTASTFGLKPFNIPVAGLFGACSTFALAMYCAAAAVSSGQASLCIAEASSHFCTAEKQFRYPLEYGGQRTPTAQRTVTGAGAVLIASSGTGPRITHGIIGRIADRGIDDISNMGAAMAPAAAQTIADLLNDTQSRPADYDMILTGDLGVVGSELLMELLTEEYHIDISKVHADCGKMIFDVNGQDVHAGGSGCGCSASVIGSKIIKELSQGKLGRVLFAGTGALMSPLTVNQKDTIPAIAHGVIISAR